MINGDITRVSCTITSRIVSIEYTCIHVRQPRHPGRGAASALPTGTLRAPLLPTGSFGGTLVVGLAAPSGLLVAEVLDGFVEGTPSMGGDPLRDDLSRFSFSPAPTVLGFPVTGGMAGSSLTLTLSFDARFFGSALLPFSFFDCTTFRSVFFSRSGLSSSSLAITAPITVTAGMGHPVGVVSSASGLDNGSDSGLSGESASMRMRLSGLGLTGE